MGATEKRLEKLGIELPNKLDRGNGVVDARLQGDMLYLSAHLPLGADGKPLYVGKVGAEVDLDTAYKAARQCGLNMLATIKD